MNLVIVAGGLGSRLAPLTNHIPKVLVNIGKNTGYVEMVRYWSNQTNLERGSLTIIVHSSYEALVAEYHKMYFPTIPLIVKTVDVANGSAHAILSTCDHLEGREVLFSWCDVLPVDDIKIDTIGGRYANSNVIFTNYNGSCRYGLGVNFTGRGVKPFLDTYERGGVFGLYYIHRYAGPNFIEYQDGQDFIEVIEQFGECREHRLEEIIDFGDMPKLMRVREKADSAREFNSVEFVGDYVLKQATNDQGKAIIEREIKWYQTLDELVEKRQAPRPSVPKTWISTDKSGFFMSRVKGVPIWKAWAGLSPVDRRYVFNQIIEQQQNIFKLGQRPVAPEQVRRDVGVEACEKLLGRYAEIKGVIDTFGPITHVNGLQLSGRSVETIINLLGERLQKFYAENPPEYGFIHGDLQMSNSMVDLDTLKVTIIDPRGYFGKTIGAGLADYDRAKLLYALDGYDLFNYSTSFHISAIKDGYLDFDFERPDRSGIEADVKASFDPVHNLWLAVCWIGLAQYIRSDVAKCVAAHYHGLILAERLLSVS